MAPLEDHPESGNAMANDLLIDNDSYNVTCEWVEDENASDELNVVSVRIEGMNLIKYHNGQHKEGYWAE